MIKFFRHIRHSLINQNKMGKYFKYAVGEILLVVIGILIALSINNWNESQKAQDKAGFIRGILINELEENLKISEGDFAENNKVLSALINYLENDKLLNSEEQKTKFIASVLGYSWANLNLPTLKQETGPNRVIRSDQTLRKELEDLNSLHTAANTQLQYLTEFWNSQVVSLLVEAGVGKGFLNTTFNIGNDVNELAKLYKTKDFDNIIAMHYMFLKSYNSRLKTLNDKLKKVIKNLKTEHKN